MDSKRSTVLFLAALIGIGLFSADVRASDRIVGVWKPISYVSRDEETGVETKPWGEKPQGLMMYTADGYMAAVGTADGRTAPTGAGEKLTEERAKLFASMTAYAGRYTVESDRIVHHVEVAWNPAWVGTDQVRYVSFEGDTLRVRTPVIVSPADGRRRTATFHFRRAK
ncbi:hypothetical protein ASC78_21165 [Variovorax sp. Root318D1]|uniref:lipocalin-like domain-containing protein n=1 Tax=Variovorax sp. Root318D1 TaxID=1736513 RepID=UPI0006F89B18|nr:lipocalin-like domain-containing protein [Variovorax sp. Root318D1]KQU89694.1 hypothetical protein ASC78_21165 [Variovorax sp. Root318D1]